MVVTYFRERKPGPELAIEDAVAKRTCALFPNVGPGSQTFGSIPVGAGIPDLIHLGYEPEVASLAHVDVKAAQVLAYLRVVRRACLTTVADRLGMQKNVIHRWLEQLADVGAVSQNGRAYSLSPSWQTVLSEVISIEAKVSDWRRAAAQAARNRIFSAKSFIAVPEKLASRVRDEDVFAALGIGILAVGGDDVRVVRRARTGRPRVWSYYYQLAFIIAKHLGDTNGV